jgi:4-amino-4-deoxy-L-arabinose transferase-like glycosyltransferase
MTVPMSPRRFAVALAGIAALALSVRVIYPAADPPWNPTVGIVWHDEGAWVHNARNKALFGVWTTDAWNPMYVAPVFTGLEYAAFAALGVGVRQARLVSELTGFASVILLALGVARIAGREAGLIAGALLATNYVYVMYDRAAIMEASMVAFMVAAWYCYARAQDDPRWGTLAAACAVLSYFTKAAAAFFIAALAAEALLAVWSSTADRPTRRAGLTTLGALTVCGLLALIVFVLPNWAEYRFYNWQMSVTRKPSYDIRSLIDRATWFPVLHDIFTRMWFVVVTGLAAALGLLARWRRASPPERLLVLWIAVGTLELLLHDVGNERRFLIFVPALVALAAILLARDRVLLPTEIGALSRRQALLALPLVAFALYIVFGAIIRIAFLYRIAPNVRLAALLATIATVAMYATWPRLPARFARGGWSPAAGLLVSALVVGGQLVQFVQWSVGRTYKNYLASIELGRHLPPGTLVHGKLANGLALENRIRPIFVGREFGNYEDRKRRDDVRYILTYVFPSLGYESQAGNPVIRDVLDAYPNHRIIMTLDVAETTSGHDRAALIDKFGSTSGGADGTGRAHD